MLQVAFGVSGVFFITATVMGYGRAQTELDDDHAVQAAYYATAAVSTAIMAMAYPHLDGCTALLNRVAGHFRSKSRWLVALKVGAFLQLGAAGAAIVVIVKPSSVHTMVYVIAAWLGEYTVAD